MHNLEDFMWQEQAYYTATCHTEECENGNISLLVVANADSPDVVCGVCSHSIGELELMPETFNITSE
jgi:uncharacterized CHY-type Zn-finger protein